MQGGQQYVHVEQPGMPNQYGGAVFATQGQVQVVTVQPASGLVEQPERDWHSGICGCCEDCESCCLTLFFPWCYMCCLSQRMGENCCTSCLICNPVLIYRTKLRTKYNIKGNIICDCCCSYFCSPLSTCQIARELKHIEKDGVLAFPRK